MTADAIVTGPSLCNYTGWPFLLVIIPLRWLLVRDRPWIFLLVSQLAFPGFTVRGVAVLHPLLHPAVVGNRNRQHALSAHALIADCSNPASCP